MDMLGRKFQCKIFPPFCLQHCWPETDRQAKEQVAGVAGVFKGSITISEGSFGSSWGFVLHSEK